MVSSLNTPSTGGRHAGGMATMRTSTEKSPRRFSSSAIVSRWRRPVTVDERTARSTLREITSTQFGCVVFGGVMSQLFRMTQ